MDWQPIDTAPKDGTPILGWSRYMDRRVIEWDRDAWWSLEGLHPEGAWTHWCPLPDPPTAPPSDPSGTSSP